MSSNVPHTPLVVAGEPPVISYTAEVIIFLLGQGDSDALSRHDILALSFCFDNTDPLRIRSVPLLILQL